MLTTIPKIKRVIPKRIRLRYSNGSTEELDSTDGIHIDYHPNYIQLTAFQSRIMDSKSKILMRPASISIDILEELEISSLR